MHGRGGNGSLNDGESARYASISAELAKFSSSMMLTQFSMSLFSYRSSTHPLRPLNAMTRKANCVLV